MEGKRKHIALMGGSFNPVHIGHIMVADYVRQVMDFDEVLMCVSPLNPLKAGIDNLASDTARMDMLQLACENRHGLIPCDIELTMPRPSYTIDTLNLLSRLHPDCDISIIIGGDNWQLFDRWRAAEEIFERFGVVVYPRPGYVIDSNNLHENVTIVDSPSIDLSSTFLRTKLAQGLDMNIFLPQGVYNYIKNHKLYGTD